SYIWDFGDRTVDTNRNPIHTFTKSGKYNITLVVKSKEGCTHTKIWENAISVSEKINASFTADKTQGCAPLTVNFTPTKDTDTGLIYNWNFGNGKTSSQRNPTMIFDYGKQDSFYVKLLLTNRMCSDSFGQWIKILNLHEDKDTAKMILATVENNQSVKLHWHKLNVAKIYYLQRSANGTNFNYSTYVNDTSYLDAQTDVQNQSYYYKITGIDDCGGRSAPGPTVRTILLQASVFGEDESAELNWNNYEGFDNNTAHNLLTENNLLYSTISKNAFTDLGFFDENLLQRCYVVEAENEDEILKSTSNQVCINYLPRIWIPNSFSPNNDNKTKPLR
ncbi:MAG: PKD domain-containing protein, partial [Bacteroidia bacterium]